VDSNVSAEAYEEDWQEGGNPHHSVDRARSTFCKILWGKGWELCRHVRSCLGKGFGRVIVLVLMNIAAFYSNIAALNCWTFSAYADVFFTPIYIAGI
jgi:hypothetical protein